MLNYSEKSKMMNCFLKTRIDYLIKSVRKDTAKLLLSPCPHFQGHIPSCYDFHCLYVYITKSDGLRK